MRIDIISKEQILEELYSKQRFGIKPGLSRTLALCETVGNPQLKFKTIHVAGTNGKGSVCSSLASVLMCAGYKTGLYTSPHLVEFNERIRIDQKLISDDELIEYYLKLKDKSDEIKATFFEITTVMAFLHFADQNIDIAVIETGMGGRFDSTNVIEPLITIITKIDLDHQEYLGNTLESIASEKAGIIKQNIPCVVAKNEPVVYDEIEKYAQKEQLLLADKLIELERHEVYSNFTSSWTAKYGNNDELFFKSSLSGTKQFDNLKAILLAAFELRNLLLIKDEDIAKGLLKVKENTGLKARIDIISYSPMIIIDGSHNESSIENLFDTIAEIYPEKLWNVVFNSMADKSMNNLIYFLEKYSKSIVVPSLKVSRANNSIELASKLSLSNLRNVSYAESTSSAIESLSNKGDILIFGSFYLVGEALEYFKNTISL